MDSTIVGIIVVATTVAFALTWVYARQRRWFRRVAVAAIVAMLAGVVVVLAIPLVCQPID